MRGGWSVKTHIVDVDRKLRIDGKSRGAAQHVEERKGFTLVVRGDVGRMIDHDFECPAHGVFTASVPSDAVPDVMPCPTIVEQRLSDPAIPVTCAGHSPWRAPLVGQGYAAGEVTC